MCLCVTNCYGGVSHHFGGVLTSLKKYRAIWGIAAIVSQYRAIWGHYEGGSRMGHTSKISALKAQCFVSGKFKSLRSQQIGDHPHPEGLERHLDAAEAKTAARQFLPLNCRASALTAGEILKEEKKPSLWGRDKLGGILRDKNCRETVGSQFLPRGIKMPRRALWAPPIKTVHMA